MERGVGLGKVEGSRGEVGSEGVKGSRSEKAR